MSFLLPVTADSSTWHVTTRTDSLATEIPQTKPSHDSCGEGIPASVCELDPFILPQSEWTINLPFLLYLIRLTCSFRYLRALLACSLTEWLVLTADSSIPKRFSSDSHPASIYVNDGGCPEACHLIHFLLLVCHVCPSANIRAKKEPSRHPQFADLDFSLPAT